MLQTEFEFTLPCGYVDEQGNLHRQGAMRRATALDEVEPLRDPRVRANEAYLSILLLSRVITRLGTVRPGGDRAPVRHRLHLSAGLVRARERGRRRAGRDAVPDLRDALHA